MGWALENLVQCGPPGSSIWLSQCDLQMEHSFSRIPTAQQPQNSQPFDALLVPHEDLP